MFISDSKISNNFAEGNGGGVVVAYGTLIVDSSTISDNTALDDGGGIWVGNSDAEITHSVLSSNTANRGGGLFVWYGNSLVLQNSTVANNTALVEDAGGIFNIGDIDVSFSTIADNTSGTGYGMGIRNESASAVLTANIISNPGGNNCGGLYTSGGYNIDDDDTCGLIGIGDIVGQPAGLGPFIDTGDYHSHFPLLSDSLAVDLADLPSFPANDQRHVQRPQDGDDDGLAVCDSGAIERTEVLFTDGFEFGDTSAWSYVVP